MENQIVKADAPLVSFSREKITLIKSTVAKGATDDELKLFLYQCEKTGLDPLAKQIYFQKRRTKSGDQMTIITGIDGYRLIADRTGKYAGNDDPVYSFEDDDRKATVTVYKMVAGQRRSFSASARWSQYYPGPALGFMWDKMPHLMLGKCAEALALRKAFPAELSGIYTNEEMEQAGPPKKDEEPQPEADPIPDIFPSKPVELKAVGPREEQVYSETLAQIEIFKAIGRNFGVTSNPQLKKISAACKGLKMSQLQAAFKEYLTERLNIIPASEPSPEPAH